MTRKIPPTYAVHEKKLYKNFVISKKIFTFAGENCKQEVMTWKDIYKRKPEWFKELFRWLKERGDGSYAIVRHDMMYHPYEFEFPIRKKRYLLQDLTRFYSLNRNYDKYIEMHYAWKEHLFKNRKSYDETVKL